MEVPSIGLGLNSLANNQAQLLLRLNQKLRKEFTMDSDIRKLQVLARKLTEASAVIDRVTDELVAANAGLESMMPSSVINKWRKSFSEVILELKVVTRGYRELAELTESAAEHSIPLSVDTVLRELRNLNAKLPSTLVRWEEADASTTGDDDDDNR